MIRAFSVSLLLWMLGCFCLTFPASAQITITSSQMPSSNDTIRYSLVDPRDTIDYLKAGPNQVWDFKNLVPINEGLFEYKSATAVNLTYGLFFGFGSYGLKILDTLDLGAFKIYDVYDFYSKSSSTFKAVGRGLEFQGVPQPSFFSDDDEIYKFPLEFGDRDSTNFAVKFVFNILFSLEQKGHRINEVEGWGSITTPFKTYNCLKVKTTIVERDSVVVNGFGLPAITRTTVEYKWLALEEKMPVMEVIGNQNGSQFTPVLVRFRGRQEFTATPEWMTVKQMEIYPNPARTKLYVKLPTSHVFESITITDIRGSSFEMPQYITSESLELNIEALPVGMYVLRWEGKEGVYYRHFMVD